MDLGWRSQSEKTGLHRQASRPGVHHDLLQSDAAHNRPLRVTSQFRLQAKLCKAFLAVS